MTPKKRRATFLEWLSNIEVAFLKYKYTRKILKDYSTKHKIRSVKSDSINRMIYSVCYAFLEKNVRTSTMTYKDDGIALLRALSTKCASIDSQTRLRAKNAFINCKMSQEETAINFLTRLEQKANEARNYDINISEKKFIYRLLDNMKHHKYYRRRIASLLTQFELNNSVFNQRWLENKFYALDEERALMSNRFSGFRGSKAPITARFASQKSPHKKDDLPKKKRCRYCYKLNHTENECRDRLNKRPPSMPSWVSKAKCNKCGKKGHLSFNCPPKFKNQVRKPPKENRCTKYNADKPDNKNPTTTDETAAVAQTEFAGYTTALHPNTSTKREPNIQNNQRRLHMRCKHRRQIRCNNKGNSQR